MTPYISVDDLIELRNRLTDRRDEQIDYVAVDEIDAQLHDVPPGTRNDVDLLLGRGEAVLPERQDTLPEHQHMHQCGWCGEYYIGARVDHGCPPPPTSAMEQDYINSFDAPRPGYFVSQSVTLDAVKPLADAMIEQYGSLMSDSPRDWKDLRGDCDL